MKTEIHVKRSAIDSARAVQAPLSAPAEGEVLFAVDKFALTANNISYAVAGDMIGYWNFFPASDDWGIVPVWGFADAVDSRVDAVPVGTRIWGFLPMASHVVMQPTKVGPSAFVDGAAHRRALPGLYNRYAITDGDAAELRALEDERCALFPLTTTSFVLFDWLDDYDFFGARQVLIGSSSSKTGFGLADILHANAADRIRVVGLTSPRNADFVRALGSCDAVVTYDAIATLDPSIPAAFIDMSGAADVVTAVHRHFGDNLKVSSSVGVTHWQSARPSDPLPGAAPTFFFAPAQIEKREQEWGPGEMLRRANVENARIARKMAGMLTITHARGADAVVAAYGRMARGETPPSEVVMLSLRAER